MTLSSLFHAVFGGAFAAKEAATNAHREWRMAIHASKNEVTKAIATARHGVRTSNEAYTAIAETIKKQEQTTVDRDFIDRARGLR